MFVVCRQTIAVYMLFVPDVDSLVVTVYHLVNMVSLCFQEEFPTGAVLKMILKIVHELTTFATCSLAKVGDVAKLVWEK